jgi:hypothetical protein
VNSHRPAERPIHRDADQKISHDLVEIFFDGQEDPTMLLSR